MVQTVYVALAGVIKEGAWVLGVGSTAENAKAMCEADARDDGELQWRGSAADHPALASQYYEVKACVVDN
jgi:hypothetical protein